MSAPTQGAIEALTHHGSDAQKATYLPRMLTGEWAGTMNLTEPQAGSDLGAVTTRRAAPVPDHGPDHGPGTARTRRITGQKIFITWGEHDLTENIVHLVLAHCRAPPGPKGISMFLVPKYLRQRRRLARRAQRVGHCVSIEHKLGIHGSPTCVLSLRGRDRLARRR